MTRLALAIGLTWLSFAASAIAAEEADWSAQQIPALPKSETAVRLFNGKDTTGWEGQTDKYFSVQDGIIVAKNDEANAPQASSYLLTKKKYRNFRLIFESKLVTSEMHSGIAMWGKAVESADDPYSYLGHLVMYPSGYGFWDLYRRNSIYQDKQGLARAAGKQHDWNRMEILAIGNRIRHVINGKLVADWSDPRPELCQSGPIGLQLHSNRVPQEIHFRGLVLTEDPENELVTVDDTSSTPMSIAAELETFVANKQIAGAVTLVAKEGRVVEITAVGKANVASGQAMQTDTVFQIASMTKPITAAAVMILQDEGKLSVDDLVSKYVPEFAGVALKTGTPKREVTIRDLMTHTAGMTGSQDPIGTLAATGKEMARRPLAFEPGSKWHYSPGLTVCGQIVEIVSEQPFAEFVSQRILEPLKMDDTTFTPDEAMQKRIATIYQPTGDKKSIEAVTHRLSDLSKPRAPNPSGGLFSTAADMARFYQMVLNGGELVGARILSKKAVEQMTSVQTGDLKTGFTAGNGWGLGWCVVRKPQGVTEMLSPGTYGHGGLFGTQGWVDPSRKMIFVLMIQRVNFGNGDGSDVRGAFQKRAMEIYGS